MRMNALCVCLLLALPVGASAHDASAHKGKPVRGTVTAVSEGTLTLSTDDGPASVTLTADTKVERGEKDVGRGALTSGARVAVFGTKVPGEGLVAKEVVLEGDTPHEAGHGEGHEGQTH